MSHFYGKIRGNRGAVTRCGSKSSGMMSHAAGWEGAIRTTIWHDEQGRDRYEVSLTPWQNSGGYTRLLSSGVLSAEKPQHCPVRSALGGVKFALDTLKGYNVETSTKGPNTDGSDSL